MLYAPDAAGPAPVTARLSLAAALLWLTLAGAQARADVLYLEDGSEIRGEVIALEDGSYRIETGFAGELQVPGELVLGVTTDGPITVTLGSGERLSGQLRYAPDQGQVLSGTAAGDLTLSGEQSLAAIGGEEQEGAAEPEEVEEVQVPPQQAAAARLWSGDIALGLNGASGNTDLFGIHGRAEVRRATNGDRLTLYTEGDFQEENNETTAEEILAGASVERDFDRHWFAHGNTDFEKDRFENLKLRAVANAGVGYFLFRRENLNWKALAGVGYQHESYEDGGSKNNAVVSLGYDFSYHLNGWVELLHKLTYFPSLSDPTNDYRLVSSLSAQMPVANTEDWKVRLSLRNQYDSEPQEGVEQLDTTYSLNLVYDWR